MSIPATIDLIQTVNRGVAGVRLAPALAAYPLKADTADLPLVLTWPSEGTWQSELGGSKRRQDRTYRVICFLEPLGQSELPKRLDNAAMLLQAMIETWLEPYTAALASPVNAGDKQVTVAIGQALEDTGITPTLTIGGVPHFGFELRLRVRELW